MKLTSRLLILLSAILTATLLSNCTKPRTTDPSKLLDLSSSESRSESKKTAPPRLAVVTEEEVTFYPTYGYRKDGAWHIQVRGRVHENRKYLNQFVTKVAEIRGNCSGDEMHNFQARSDDFEDDDKALERVIVKFDSDPEDRSYEFERSNLAGIVNLNLTLPEERAALLLEKQGSTNGWLTFRAVSGDHTGLGRVRLIDPDGVSVVSDIDDTIKVTEIPAGQNTILRNTFCRDFKAAPEMAEIFADFGDAAFHYVSGGPEQMFGPLYDFLIVGPGGFPEGTFHLNFFPKNLLVRETKESLQLLVTGSLDATYAHKLKEITSLMERFPNRQFILVGDSGELDPEVYRELRRVRGGQVKEIWIRDVLGDAVANGYRFEGMKIVEADPPGCIDEKYLARLSEKMRQIYSGVGYRRSSLARCE